MPTAPPVADTKKPATPPPAKDDKNKAAGDKNQAGADTATPGGKGAQDKNAGADKGKTAPAAGQAAQNSGAGAAQSAAASQQRFDRMAVRAKLAVSEPGDAVEREADAVADKVMRATAPPAEDKEKAKDQGKTKEPGKAVATPPAAGGDKQQLARAAAADKPTGSSKSDEQTKQATDAKQPGVAAGHPRPASTEGTRGGAATKGSEGRPEIAREADTRTTQVGDKKEGQEEGKDSSGRLSVPADFADQLGAGEPLDAQTRVFFEQRLEADLAGVRIHTDAAADKAAKQIQARAFTYGRHIAFANGQYQPGSNEGRRLLAHELAHVQQQDSQVARTIMRQPAGSAPAGGNSNEIALKGVKIPAFKLGYYTAADYRRQANYRRSEKGSKQKKLWTDGTKAAREAFPGKWGLKEGAVYVAAPKKTKLTVTNKDLLVGESKMLAEMIQRPKWKKDGTPNPHDIDHMVELQIGGGEMDKLDNLELRDSKANQDSGRTIDADITTKLRQVKDKENGDPEKIRANSNYVFVFSEFASGGGSKDSSVWTKEQINNLEAADGLSIYDPDASAGNDKVKAWPKGVDKEDFFGAPDLLVIYPSRRGGKPEKIKLNKDGKPKTAGQIPKEWIPGFTIDSFDLNPGAGDQLGSLSMSFAIKQFPSGYTLPVIPIRKLSSGLDRAGFVSVDGVRNKIGAMLNAKTPVPQTSPVTVDDIDILPGSGLSITGQIHPSVKFLGGPIDFEVQGKNFELSKNFNADEIKIPGPFKVKYSSLTVALNSATGFSVTGAVGYEIPKLGEGSLVGKGKMSGFLVSGTFTFDKKLFDGKAELSATYEKAGEEGKFSGTATLEITEKKIKGIKKASILATIDNEKFTLDGKAETSIPGIKEFSVAIKFVDAENFSISGKGDFEKLPGIESGSLTMTLDRAGDAWELSGKGSATPKLPGGFTGTIDGSYNKGVVLVRGKVGFKFGDGLLDGKVTVAVTNAASVDKDGNPSGEGGESFKIFGEGDLKATLIKDKLDGNLKLRLLPDGGVRVAGGLEVKPFEVFGKYPKDGGEFFNKPFSTPPVPLPGLGFAIGSVSVGITFSASLTLKAYAAVGPGKISGITVNVEEFDPENVDLKSMKFSGNGTFVVYADAGFSAAAAINLIFGAAVAELVGSIGVEAKAGIPADKPVLSAGADFTYSQNEGLDISGEMKLTIAPELKFRLFGKVAARLNVVVDTITVWSKDFTLAEANYKLPIGINASGKLGYNTKTGKVRPDKLSDAIKVDTPELSGDTMKGVLLGESAPPKVETTADGGSAPPTTVNPKRANDSAAAGADEPPLPVDEDLVTRLGSGFPLDLATRGYFEQRMKVDLTQVLIHTGPAAAGEADKLAARAFTVGEHIAFAEGEFAPTTPEGQELIAHELAHIAQQQAGGAPIVLRWPAVTRTDAHTAETPATIRARDLSGFVALTESQRDWATSPALQGDPPALGTFRDIRTFADGPNIQDACGGLNVGDIVAKGVPAVYPALRKYTDGVSGGTAWLRWTDDTTKAERWGGELTSLEAAWPATNLSLVMRAPDPVSNPSPFERLEDPASPELPNFISYLSTCHPILSADDGSEVDSFLDLRAEGGTATAYTASVTHVTNYHHFTKNTLEGLARNEAVPQWEQNNWFFSRPMTAVLYPTVDHNGAFHRNRGLEGMVTSGDILTIVLEGHASVADYTAELAPVAARYGKNGEIQQVMIGGHGNTNILQLAGSMSGNTIAHDSLGTSGTGGANTTALMAEIVLRTGSDPARRRIVLDACLTNSHLVQSPLNPVAATAASEIQTAITANPSLRDFMAGSAGAGAHVFGSNSSFVPAQTTFLTPGTTDIGLSVPGDPDLIADKLTYVEFGTEPEGCMRALLEAWSADQRAGTHACRDAVRRRIAAGNSGHVLPANRESWREAIIQPLYDLSVNHYWGNGEALRQFGFLAGALFELKWANNTNATTLATRLGALGGNAAHVDRLLGSVAADPRYAGSARIAIVIEQAWMQHRPARRAQFLTALGRYGSCNEAVADVQMGLVMAEVPALLALPPPAPPPADQLRLALLAAHHAPVVIPPPSPLPAHADFLNQLLGAGPNFPPGLGITAALGGLRGGENGILTAIGKPVVGGGAPPGVGPAPAANVNLGRADAPDRNDFRVTPLRRNGLVATVRDNLNVRRRPTTGSSSLGSLAPGSAVFVIGEYGDWYAIEQPNATGFVAKRYVTLLP